MISSQPQLIARLTTLLADRIWFIYKQLANTLISDSLGRMYDALLIQLEKNRVPLNSKESYIFNFGPRELASMVGLAPKEANILFRHMLESKKITLENGKIFITSIVEILKQTEFYRKMQKLEDARKESRALMAV
jgi:CRP-like cAMP-binding protein